MNATETKRDNKAVRSKDNARAFFESFIVVLLLTFLPFKALGFLIPIIFLTVLMLRSSSYEIPKRLILLVVCCACIIGFYRVAFFFEAHHFIPSNGMLSFINYSSFLVLLLLPARVTSESYNYARYVKILLPVIAFEGLYGIAQRILSSLRGIPIGDLVEGTISPFSVFIGATSGFGNQFYAINMIFLLVFCFPYVCQHRKGIVHFFIGIVAVLLASVGHAFYSLVFAAIITMGYFEARAILLNPKRLIVLAMIPAILLSALAILDPSVFNGAARQAKEFYNFETPKSKAIQIVFTRVAEEYPSVHFIGLGPGQYSSRAALIASGQYGSMSQFFIGLPFFSLGIPEAFKSHVLVYWKDYQKNSGYGNSTMNRPFLSLLSVYAEYGAIVFTFLILYVCLVVTRSKTVYKRLKSRKSDISPLLPFSTAISLIFLVLIGVYENYYEAPQGVFVGIVLMYLSYQLSKQPKENNHASHSGNAHII